MLGEMRKGGVTNDMSMNVEKDLFELQQRRRFEAWISGLPYERSIVKIPSDGYAWPGQYRDIGVRLAWESWQEALR